MRIEQLEQEIASLIHDQFRSRFPDIAPKDQGAVTVELVGPKGRKVNKNSNVEDRLADVASVKIVFETRPELNRPKTASESSDARLADLVKALDDVESKPGYEFIALKWFRDTYLPMIGAAWSTSQEFRNQVMRQATESRMVLTNRHPNPKNLAFPVTAIKLNRLHPSVQQILRREQADPDFIPVRIRGENLSTTILRERR